VRGLLSSTMCLVPTLPPPTTQSMTKMIQAAMARHGCCALQRATLTVLGSRGGEGGLPGAEVQPLPVLLRTSYVSLLLVFSRLLPARVAAPSATHSGCRKWTAGSLGRPPGLYGG